MSENDTIRQNTRQIMGPMQLDCLPLVWPYGRLCCVRGIIFDLPMRFTWATPSLSQNAIQSSLSASNRMKDPRTSETVLNSPSSRYVVFSFNNNFVGFGADNNEASRTTS